MIFSSAKVSVLLDSWSSRLEASCGVPCLLWAGGLSCGDDKTSVASRMRATII